MNQTLLEKFDAIEVKLEDQIATEDHEFCQNEQLLYDKTIKQLNDTELFCRTKLLAEPNDSISLEESENAQKDFSSTLYPFIMRSNTSSDSEKFYNSYHFGWAYPIRDIWRLKVELRSKFIDRIKDYYIKKYHLELPGDLDSFIKKLGMDVTWLQIINLIKDGMGGILDFKGSAIQQKVEEFQKNFMWRKPILNGDIIELPDYIYWGRESSFNYFGHSDKEALLLDTAISIFELEEVKTDYAIMYLKGQKCKFQWETVLNGEKIEAFRCFKNRKVQLKFKDSMLAAQFINRFALNTVNS